MRWHNELFPIHEQVIADEKSVFHGRGRNLERLKNKGDDEQTRDQHFGQRGEKFYGRFRRLLPFARLPPIVFLFQLFFPGQFHDPS